MNKCFSKRGQVLKHLRFEQDKWWSVTVNCSSLVNEIDSRSNAIQDDDGLSEHVEVDDVGVLCGCVRIHGTHSMPG